MFQNYIPEVNNENAQKLIATLVILIAAILIRVAVALFINSFVGKVSESSRAASSVKKRTQTIASLIANISNIGILGAALVMILAEWGFNIAPIITGLGIFGLAISFGTQTLVRDIVSGFFILFENTYNVGDKIKIAGVEGSVKEINLRTTVLKDDEGRTFIVPNSAVQTVEKGLLNKPKAENADTN